MTGDLGNGGAGSSFLHTGASSCASLQEREQADDQDIASDLRLPRGHPFNLPQLASLPGLPALEALSKQKELLGGNIILPSSSPQGLLKAPSNLFPSHHPGFPPLRPPSQVASSHPTPHIPHLLLANLTCLTSLLQPTSGSQSNSPSDFGTQQNWSFEEQFKQVFISIHSNTKNHYAWRSYPMLEDPCLAIRLEMF